MTTTLARLALYVLSLVLAMIPASWATHGITYDGASLHLRLDALIPAGTITLLSALGLSGAVYGLWGDGGAAGLGRTVLYVLSPLWPALAAAGMGLGVTLADGVLSVHVETLLTALFAGGAISAGILRRWGVR